VRLWSISMLAAFDDETPRIALTLQLGAIVR
jgi:hypothetical protein